MNRYEVFVKVAECGSFTRAANELGYTQSAVSQMVHTLEAVSYTHLDVYKRQTIYRAASAVIQGQRS